MSSSASSTHRPANSARRRTRIRRLNFITPEKMPYKTATGRIYDTGEFEGHMRRAMELADWDGFKRASRGEAAGPARPRHRPRLLYRGLLRRRGRGREGAARDGRRRDGADRHAIERAGAPDRLCPARLAAPRPPVERVRVLQGDTDMIATGGGTGGSRSIPVGGASVAGRLAACSPTTSRARGGRARSRRGATSRSPTAACASPAPTGPSPSPISRSCRRRRRTGSPPPTAGRRRRRPIRTAPMSARSRSTRRPARPRSCATRSSTISASR